MPRSRPSPSLLQSPAGRERALEPQPVHSRTLPWPRHAGLPPRSHTSRPSGIALRDALLLTPVSIARGRVRTHDVSNAAIRGSRGHREIRSSQLPRTRFLLAQDRLRRPDRVETSNLFGPLHDRHVAGHFQITVQRLQDSLAQSCHEGLPLVSAVTAAETSPHSPRRARASDRNRRGASGKRQRGSATIGRATIWDASWTRGAGDLFEARVAASAGAGARATRRR